MTMTRDPFQPQTSNPGHFAWGWIAAAFVLGCSALVWVIIAELIY